MRKQGKQNSGCGRRGGKGNCSKQANCHNSNQEILNLGDRNVTILYFCSNKIQKEFSSRVPFSDINTEKQPMPLYDGTWGDKKSFLTTANKL